MWGWEGVDWFGQIGNYMDSMNIDVWHGWGCLGDWCESRRWSVHQRWVGEMLEAGSGGGKREEDEGKCTQSEKNSAGCSWTTREGSTRFQNFGGSGHLKVIGVRDFICILLFYVVISRLIIVVWWKINVSWSSIARIIWTGIKNGESWMRIPTSQVRRKLEFQWSINIREKGYLRTAVYIFIQSQSSLILK